MAPRLSNCQRQNALDRSIHRTAAGHCRPYRCAGRGLGHAPFTSHQPVLVVQHTSPSPRAASSNPGHATSRRPCGAPSCSRALRRTRPRPLPRSTRHGRNGCKRPTAKCTRGWTKGTSPGDTMTTGRIDSCCIGAHASKPGSSGPLRPPTSTNAKDAACKKRRIRMTS
jgi:hypothetical protein